MRTDPQQGWLPALFQPNEAETGLDHARVLVPCRPQRGAAVSLEMLLEPLSRDVGRREVALGPRANREGRGLSPASGVSTSDSQVAGVLQCHTQLSPLLGRSTVSTSEANFRSGEVRACPSLVCF